MALKHIQILYRDGNQRQEIASVRDSASDYIGTRDSIPPYYIRSWEETEPQDVLDLVDNTIKSALVTKQECLNKNLCVEVLTVDANSAPSTWRFISKNMQIERDNKEIKLQRYYDTTFDLRIEHGSFADYLISLRLPTVWTLNTV